ncbi:RDD family protein [Paucibacter sp. KCTC 42545]|uniref:RDD family protein n=1 Tax=Paucibacter sp. KCTC 42545 TaxID=1768242 RepID=UPI000733C0FE|nr:RDD family protein [Paucibacter sp. KCTC 42545]ALT79098.1 hypothetical protein AT984_19800 [Paucibacter sp. KCTC 42545]
MNYASFWQRFLAGIIDFLIFLPIIFLQNWLEADSKLAGFVLALATAFAFFAYSLCCHAKYGKTLGKHMVGIRVVTVSGQPLGWRRATLRVSVDGVLSILQAIATIWAIAHIPDALYYGVGWQDRIKNLTAYELASLSWVGTATQIWYWSELVVMLLDDKRRALHDYLAGSVVISEGKSQSTVASSV